MSLALSDVLFYLDPKYGRDIALVGGVPVVARSTVGSTFDEANRITTSMVDTSRFERQIIDGVKRSCLMNEPASTNLTPSKVLSGYWDQYSTDPTITDNTTEVLDPMGGYTASKVVFGSGARLERSISFGSASAAMGVWIRAAVGTTALVELGMVGFSSYTGPTFTVTDQWQFISHAGVFASTIVLARIAPSAGTPTVYIWRPQTEARSYITSYVESARAAELSYYNTRSPFQASVHYFSFVEGSLTTPSADLHGQYDGVGAPWILIYRRSASAEYRAEHHNGVGTRDSRIALSAVPGDRIELCRVLNTDGTVRLTARKNGGAVLPPSGSSTGTLSFSASPIQRRYVGNCQSIDSYGKISTVVDKEIKLAALVGSTDTDIMNFMKLGVRMNQSGLLMTP